ncbi:MAG TPA: hypothetical protein PK961_04765 [bacterium]|nr:hypothetical protein [bacterium]
MKRFCLTLIVAALLLGALPWAAAAEEEGLSAIGFDMHGYYRVRYDSLFKPSWAVNDGGDSDWYSYIDQRFLLNSTLLIADPIRIHVELDMLKNTLWGDNQLESTPSAVIERMPNDPTTIQNVSFENLTLNTVDPFAQSVSNTGLDGEDVDPVQIRQLYGEVLLPIGFLRFGRMAQHFGMGIYTNSGSPYARYLGRPDDLNDLNSGFDADYGDVADSLLFGTRVAGLYYPILSYDRVAEEDFRSGKYDIHQLSLTNYFRDITFSSTLHLDGGLAFNYRMQDATDARLWLYNLWARLAWAGFTAEAEAMATQGSLKMIHGDEVNDLRDAGLPVGKGGGKIDANAFLAATRFGYDARRWGAGLEYGISSPSDSNPDDEFDPAALAAVRQAAQQAAADPDDADTQIDFVNTVINNQAAFGRHMYTIGFDRDYNVDLIGWETLMGGSVQNGMYAKLGGFIRPLDGMDIRLDVIGSFINESGHNEDGEEAAHDLGWESDLAFAYTFHKRFTSGFSFGYFWPGGYCYDRFDDVQNVYTLQMKAIIDF